MIKHKLECMKERSVSDIWFLLYEKWNRSVAEEIIHESLSQGQEKGQKELKNVYNYLFCWFNNKDEFGGIEDADVFCGV